MIQQGRKLTFNLQIYSTVYTVQYKPGLCSLIAIPVNCTLQHADWQHALTHVPHGSRISDVLLVLPTGYSYMDENNAFVFPIIN